VPSIDGPQVHRTTASANAQEPDAATYNAFVGSLELAEIELVKVSGERVAAGAATQTRFDLTAGYLQDGMLLHYRYEAIAHLINDAEADLGHVVASIVLTVRTATAAGAACIERFGATSGALMVHPYLRETIASIAQRLDFSGVLLPMIKYQPDDGPVSHENGAETSNAGLETQVEATSKPNQNSD
jgi:hypothetical protein